MPDGLRERLIAATAKWRKLDSERDDARKEVLDAAAAMLKAGALPAEVVGLTPFSDALVRSETRKRGAPEARRGPKRKEETKPASDSPFILTPPTATPFKAPMLPPSQPTTVPSREELLAIARDLTTDDQVRIATLIGSKNRAWSLPYRHGPDTLTPLGLIEAAINAGRATEDDLR